MHGAFLYFLIILISTPITPQSHKCGGILINPNGLPPHSKSLKSSGPQVLYLNFEGAHLKHGTLDDPRKNISWIIDISKVGSEVDFPAFDPEPYKESPLQTRQDVIDAIVGWVRDYYAPMNIIVTTKRPPDAIDYTMIMIGGSPEDIGHSGGGEVGVAPFDCYNQNRREIGYAFAAELNNIQDLAVTIAHEAGHSFGLAHVDMTHAIMYPMVTSDPYWGEGAVPDGQACGGGSHQNSLDELHKNLGEIIDNTSPWVQFMEPGDMAIVPSRIPVILKGGDGIGIPIKATIYLDGEEWGTKQWPFFTFTLLNVPKGSHRIKAMVYDRAGNVGMSDITVNVDPNCTQKGSCGGGLNAVGESCKQGSDCESGLCVFSKGKGVCSKECVPDTSSCGWGVICAQYKAENYCSEDENIDTVIFSTDEYLIGCSASSFKGGVSKIWLMLLFIIMIVLYFKRITAFKY